MSLASDYEIALRLQNESERDLKYKTSKKEHTSIIDTEWEKLDPNPDIYVLFQTFDKKFFWGKLESVEVKWSKRMYSCAGICTYKGKAGGCCISLSLPLLQLRPRKDLVETLLHEMIHAYLFITAKKQDREEHGPLFHEHMHRINKSAGTKITVYHTFHDEVRHYKQHWWRCNGTCQSRKPFFGLVKRSMNRAPGPNDFWFAEHQSTCGGEFIKIKEPENFKARKSKNKSKVDTASVTKYFPKQSESAVALNSTEKSVKNINKPSSSKKNKTGASVPSGSASKLTNYFPSVVSPSPLSFDKDNKKESSPEHKRQRTNNIHGFIPFKGNSSEVSSAISKDTISDKPLVGGFGTGLKSNKGGTLIMNPRPSSSLKSNEEAISSKKEKVIPFSGTGHVLGGVADRSKSILLSMFENKPAEAPVNEECDYSETEKNVGGTTKKRRPEVEKLIALSKARREEERLAALNQTSIETKFDQSSSSEASNKGATVSGNPVSSTNKMVGSECLVISSDSDEEAKAGSENIVNCPVCGFQTLDFLVNEHLDECTGLETVLENVQIIDDENDFDLLNQVKCPSCGLVCLEDEINEHLDMCLN